MHMKLDELQEKARQLTFEILQGYIIPDDIRDKLVIGTMLEEGRRIFELYVPGEKPSDARVISRAIMDPETGQGTVEVIGLEKKEYH